MKKKQPKEQLEINKLKQENESLSYRIRRLDAQLTEAEISNRQLSEYRDRNEGFINIKIESLNQENKNLLEIIRWSINPQTAIREELK